MEMRERTHYLYAALFQDGGEYGIWGAMSGGVLWAVIGAVAVAVMVHLLHLT